MIAVAIHAAMLASVAFGGVWFVGRNGEIDRRVFG